MQLCLRALEYQSYAREAVAAITITRSSCRPPPLERCSFFRARRYSRISCARHSSHSCASGLDHPRPWVRSSDSYRPPPFYAWSKSSLDPWLISKCYYCLALFCLYMRLIQMCAVILLTWNEVVFEEFVDPFRRHDQTPLPVLKVPLSLITIFSGLLDHHFHLVGMECI